MAQEARQRLGEFNSQNLANTAWSFARMGQLDGVLFAALAKEVKQHLGKFNALDLGNMA